jgi:polysaccharide export outer membrane protein
MRILIALGLWLGLIVTAGAQTLRVGDVLEVNVFQDPKLDRKVLIAPDGMISFPLAGHIRAVGRTPQFVEETLRNRLQKNYSDKLDITVSVVSVGRPEDEERPRIYITGEIQKPGPYLVLKRINVMQAIAQAGGLGTFAAKQRIQVHRKINGVESIYYFDYDAFTNGSNITGNIDLQGGDVVVIPERGLFY